ncbi:MAG TPA: carboxypeptidase regulatory-like domain-containing protein, partial [Polyangiaceae bacterium]|nr:carboxypeptidase regulatory-like domain-containing protein [Polyangiaceae bacterium]
MGSLQWSSAYVGLILTAVLACSAPVKDERVGQTTQALSPATTRTLGFESLEDWSPLWSRVKLSLSPIHTEGQTSLALQGGGWMQVQSRPLSKEEAAPAVVGYDIRVPEHPVNRWWHGTTALFLDAPSAGVWGRYMGHADLTGFPHGQFKRVEFSVSPALRTKLNAGYTDLKLRIIVNVPHNETAAYLVDHFTFGPPTGCSPTPDGNPCTDDLCVNGLPAWPAKPVGTACDTNDTVCDGQGTCDASATCALAAPPVLDDQNPCTTDACDPAQGVVHLPVAVGVTCESDNDVCNGISRCDGLGVCVPGAAPPLDDGNPCTTDACDPQTGVSHNPVVAGTSCDTDNDVCNGGATCDGAGVCHPSPTPTLDDGNPCTADGCDPVIGVAHMPVMDGTACDDGNACTLAESCASGACQGGNARECPASDACHLAGSCESTTGECLAVPKPEGAPCDDATVCNGRETCQLGVCGAGTPSVLDDNNPCTVDSCDPTLGETHAPVAAGTSCDNADVCDGVALCNTSGACLPGTPPVIDDGLPCTVDACDPQMGVTHVAVVTGTSCGDNNACNGDELCDAGGVCQIGRPVTIDDGNPCTTDSCSPAMGVAHEPLAAGTSCSDGNACNGTEACSALGACESSFPPQIDDGNPCTVDSCDAELGPVHVAATAGTACSDEDACNGFEVCDGAGACVGGSPPTVDDSNPCTFDDCDAETGVITHDPLPAGTSCGTDQTCDASGSCSSPPPVIVVPPLDPTGVTPPGELWSFLYTGPNATQVGVAPDTIEFDRVALVSGRLVDHEGAPVANARVTIADGPQYGETRSRVDGQFDLAVNGGGTLTVRVERSGYLPVDRVAKVGWHATTTVPDVVMTRLDPIATAVAMGAPTLQLATGSPQSDAAGMRQAALMIPAGTAAALAMPDGSSVPMDALTLRLTEYTVGPQGPAAMPAKLPPTTGYTYAIDLTADEAIAAGAGHVEFDRPLAFYVENFLQFPVGQPVPAGFYDAARRGWAASTNGVVLRILGTSAGLATLDLNGDGAAESATALANAGISADERAQLASRYLVGTSLWRVPITHFSPWDCNWPFGPPPCDASGACPDNDAEPEPEPESKCGGAGADNLGSTASGSIIKCEEQSLGESLKVAGTPFSLNYQSTRTRDYTARRQIRLNLTGSTIHSQLKAIDVAIDIAGQHHSQSFAPQSNLSTIFTWDGRDRFGRQLSGVTAATIEITATFPGVYYPPGSRFGASSPQPGAQTIGNRERSEISYVNRYTVFLHQAGPLLDHWGFGGWTLSPNHFYNGVATLYRGTGESVQVGEDLRRIDRIAGNGTTSFAPDGTPAKDTGLNFGLNKIYSFSAAPNGDIYLPVTGNRVVRRIDYRDGTIWTVAGTLNQPSCTQSVNGGEGGYGDGGPATSARLVTPTDTAVAPDGSIYIADWDARRVRRVRPDGIIETVAGSGNCLGAFAGDGGPATQARLEVPRHLALGDDGALYIADGLRIRKVDAGGTITTVAGNGSFGLPSTFPVRALAAPLSGIGDIALGPDGVLYIAMMRRILALRRDGMLESVSAEFSAANSVDDGVPMNTESVDVNLSSVATSPDGILYFNDSDATRDQLEFGSPKWFVRAVDPTGIVRSITRGDGSTTEGLAFDSGPTYARAISALPDGSVLISDLDNTIYRVASFRRKPCGAQSTLIPDAGGTQGFCFDNRGHHLQTLDLRTGTTLFSFDYTNGQLTTVTDADGNVTSIQRSDDAITIVAPFGQTTTIGLDTSGNATSITDASGSTLLEPTPSGLLDALTDRRGFRHEFHFSPEGLLIRDNDPAGGSQSLAQSVLVDGKRVTRTTALGRSTIYDLVVDATGRTTWTTTYPDATSMIRKTGADGSLELQSPDGTTATHGIALDAQRGLEQPYVASRT